MALTRRLLKSLEIGEDKIEQIIEAHTETVNGLRDELATAKETAAQVESLQKELQQTKQDLQDAQKSDWQEQYNNLKKDFEGYKAKITAKETYAAKEAAVKAYYQSKGLSGKALEIAMRGSTKEIEAMTLDADKQITDTKLLDDLLAGDFSALIGSTVTQGTNVAHPPVSTTGNVLTKSDIYKKDDKGRYVLSASERQKALMENHIIGKE